MSETLLETRLRDALHREAELIEVPAEHLVDVLQPPRRQRRSWLAAAAALVLVGLAGWAIITRSSAPKLVATMPNSLLPVVPLAPARPPAMVLTPTNPDPVEPEVTRAIEYHDADAAGGDWAAVVRQPFAEIGSHSVVLQMIMGDPRSNPRVAWDNGQAWWSFIGELTAHTYADEDQDLYQVITAEPRLVSVLANSEAVVEFEGRLHSSVMLSTRYGALEFLDLGGSALGSMVFCEVSTGAEAELELMNSSGPRPLTEYMIGDHIAVFDPSIANGALVWTPSPGLYVTVGWSGNPATPERIDVLRRIAETIRPITDDEWQANHPQIIDLPSGTPPP